MRMGPHGTTRRRVGGGAGAATLCAGKSEYQPRVEPAACDKAIEHAARIRSPHSAVIFFQLGAAVANLPNDHSAVGNRDARYVLNVASAWENAAEDEQHVAWARTAWSDMRRFSTGGTYLNFLTEEEGADRTKDALGKNLHRLAAIKSTWDPQNVFRTNRNIAPG
jgi:FAD/FMN-containing dehydrogenase